MARINIGNRQVQRARTTGAPRPRPGVAAAGDLAEGRAALQLGGAIANFADRVDAAEASAITTSRIADAQQAFDSFFAERSTQTDQFSTLGTDVKERLAGIREQAFEGVSNVRAQNLMAQRFSVLETSALGNAANTAQRQQIEFATEQTGNALNTNAINAANATREIDRQTIVNDSLALLDAQVDAGLMSRPTADKARERFLGTIQEQTFERLINDDPVQALKILDSSEPIENLDPGTRNTLRRAARAEVNVLKAGRAKIDKRIVDDAVFALEHGFMPPNFDEAQALARTDPALARELQLSVNQYTVISEHAGEGPDGRAAWIDRQRARKSMSKGEIQTLEAVERIHSKQASLADKDPLRLGTQKGLIRDQAPLDFTNPNVLAVQLSERKAAAAVVGDHLGEPVSPLFQSDTDELLRVLDTGGVDNQVNALGAIVAGLDDEAGGLLHQLDKSGEVVYAQVGNLLVEGDRTAALQLAQGRKIVTTDKAAAPKEAEFRDEALAYMDESFDTRQRDRAGIIKNARLLYVARGGDPLAVDAAEMRSAIDTIVGGFVDYSEQVQARPLGFREGDPVTFGNAAFGAQRLPAPAPGVSGNDFTGWIRNLTTNDVKAGGGVAGFEDNPEQVLRWIRRQDNEARLVTLGRGVYGVEIEGLTGRMELLRSADNPALPFVLDWEARK